MLKIGDSVSIERGYSEQDISAFCTLANIERNTLQYLPAPLINSLFTDMLGTKLPGPGTMYMKQESEYLDQVPLDTKLTAKVEVIRIRPENGLVNLRTSCLDETGKLYSDGEALVLFPPCKTES
ncbi:MAG: hypothetical protein K6L76_09470 [Agarilytica sp.]